MTFYGHGTHQYAEFMIYTICTGVALPTLPVGRISPQVLLPPVMICGFCNVRARCKDNVFLQLVINATFGQGIIPAQKLLSRFNIERKGTVQSR